jgi:hypothetical protein
VLSDWGFSYAWSCIEYCALRFSGTDISEALHVLMESPELDDLIASPQSLLSHFVIPYGAYVVPRLIQMISPPWSTWNLSARLEAAYYVCQAKLHSDLFWLCLGKSQLDSSCLVRKVSRENAPPLYIALVEKLAVVLSDHWSHYWECPDFGGWRSLFRTVVGLDGLRVGFEHDCASPMLTYLRLDPPCRDLSWADLSNQRLTHKLRHWATEIFDAGQDLQEYGKWERERLLAEDLTFRPRCFGRSDGCLTLRIVNFTYGAVPEDWQIWVSLSSDEWVGEFWNLLAEQDSTLCLPGAWPTIEDRCRVCDPEDIQDPSARRLWFLRSRRRRRRMVRYFDLTKESFEEYYGLERRRYVASSCASGKRRKARREQFFKEAGITPPPKLPY